MAASVNLLPPEYRRDRHRPRLIIAIAVGVIIITLGAWTGTLAGQAARLRHQVADARSTTAQFGSALDQYQALKKLEEQLSTAAGKSGKPVRPRAEAMREAQELARDVVLSGVAIESDGQATITGRAAGLPSVAAYLERLGGSQILSAPTLNSAASSDSSGVLEFEIVCRLAEGGGN